MLLAVLLRFIRGFARQTKNTNGPGPGGAYRSATGYWYIIIVHLHHVFFLLLKLTLSLIFVCRVIYLVACGSEIVVPGAQPSPFGLWSGFASSMIGVVQINKLIPTTKSTNLIFIYSVMLRNLHK